MFDLRQKKFSILLPVILFSVILVLDVANSLSSSLIKFTSLMRNLMILIAIALSLPAIHSWQRALSIYEKVKLLLFSIISIYILNYFSAGQTPIYDSFQNLLFTTAVAAATLIFILLILNSLQDLIFILRKKYTSSNFYLLFCLMIIYGLFAGSKAAGSSIDLNFSMGWSISRWQHLISLFILIIMLYFMVMNSFRTHWIKILNKTQKIKTLLIGIIILVISVLFIDDKLGLMFRYSTAAGNFMFASLLFLTIYISFSIFVTLLHLPTAGVYDRKVKEISSLHHLSQHILGVFDRDRVLGIIIERCIEVTGASYCWIILKNIRSGQFELMVHKNLPRTLLVYLNENMSGGLMDWIVKNRNTLMIEQIAKNKLTASVSHWSKMAGSLLGVPLILNDQVTGIIFAVKNVEYGFLPDDKMLMTAFANNATIAIENARLVNESMEKEKYEQELKIAHEAQMKLLPRKMPDLDWLDIQATCITANEVGGDYFDFFELAETKLGVVIGDVSGKGPEAAFYMAEVKGVLESLSHIFLSPKELLINANRVLFKTFDSKTFVSLLYGIFDRKKKIFSFCRAGHCPLIYWNHLDEGVSLIEPSGIAVGLDPGENFQATMVEETVSLRSGDVLLLFTDGVTEARNRFHEEFEEHRLSDIVVKTHAMNSAEIKNEILRQVKSFVAGYERHDDLTVVVIKIR